MKNLIKTSALALALVSGAASVASASTDFVANSKDTYFSQFDVSRASGLVDFGLVRTASEGTIFIYDFNAGKQGALLGSEKVAAGANTNVKINLQRANAGDDIIAVFVPAGSTEPTAAIVVNS